jgi:RimJ/RimL family protein N-acetyltransferase
MYSVRLDDRAEMRPLEPWRAEEFLAHMERARDHIRPWVGRSFLADDLDGARAVLQRYADSQAAGKGGIHGIWLDGTLVGGVMFVSLNSALGVAELGCWLEPAGEGHGLITRASARLIDWAITQRGIVRLEWQPLVGNEPSVRVAKRLGMRRDALIRSGLPGDTPDAPRIDYEIWSVLADEWPPADLRI